MTRIVAGGAWLAGWARKAAGNAWREEEVAEWTAWHFVGAVALAATAAAVARDAWATMIGITLTDEESSHCLLVGIAAPWLVWTRREALKRCKPVGTWIGPVIATIGWGCYIYGFDIHDNEFWFFGALLVTIGGLLSFLGIQVLLRFLPAFLVLGFLIPVPGAVRVYVSLPLQTVMAQATEQIGQMAGLDISRSGNLLMVDDQRIEVAEACNGMRMVFPLFMVAYTFAFAMPLRWWVRLVVLAAAPALALASNLLRIIPTVTLYAHAPEQTATVFHEAAGWLMIPLAFFLLQGTVGLLRWAELPVLRMPQPPVSAPKEARG